MKSTYRFFVILPMLLISLSALIFTNVSTTSIISMILFYLIVYPFSQNVAHRGIAHKQIILTPLGQKVIGFIFLFNLRGDPLGYALAHRYHHRYSDTEKDYFSPTHGLLRCFFIMFTDFDRTLIKYQALIKDYPLDKFKFFWFLYRYKPYIVWGTIILLSLISVEVGLGLILASSLAFVVEQMSMTFLEHSLFKKGPVNNPIWSKLTLADYHKDHHDHSGRSGDNDPGFFLNPLCKFLKLAK